MLTSSVCIYFFSDFRHVYQEFGYDSPSLTRPHLFLVDLCDVVCKSVDINVLFPYRVGISGILKLQGFFQVQYLR